MFASLTSKVVTAVCAVIGAIATEGNRDSLARCLAMLGSPDGDGGKSVREDIRAQQAR
jgi:hypothetical protein